MIAPFARLKKDQILWLAGHTCRAHRHAYTDHYQCYLNEWPQEDPFKERVGFFDIEASGLKGNWDFCLSYAIKIDSGKILGRSLVPSEIRNFHFDKFLVKEMINDLLKFDRIVGHYIRDRRFDMPFARSRALYWGHKFPPYKALRITDTYDLAKNKLALSSNRLESICQHLKIPSKGHKQDPATWQLAKAGNKKALAWTWAHNVEDVVSTEAVYHRLKEFSMQRNTSI